MLSRGAIIGLSEMIIGPLEHRANLTDKEF